MIAEPLLVIGKAAAAFDAIGIRYAIVSPPFTADGYNMASHF